MSTAFDDPAGIAIAQRLHNNHCSGFACYMETVKAADGILDALDEAGYMVVRKQTCSGLTKVQLRALRFIDRRLREAGTPPSLREIAEHLGAKSNPYAFKVVTHLIDREALTKLPNKSRSLSITPAGARYLQQQKGK